jgi:non-ribosomal peptide synthetase component E (peptide arylation enzyme)
MALIVPKSPFREKIEQEEIKAHIKSYVDKGVVSKFAIPDKIVFVNALERTSVGKLDKKRMRDRYASIAQAS